MGCGISKSTTPKVYRHIKINHSSNKTKGNRKEYKNFISQNNWLNILDFLNYAEIKEVGKTNKLFNYLVKQNQILIKFFKKKNDSAIDYQQHPKNNKGVNLRRAIALEPQLFIFDINNITFDKGKEFKYKNRYEFTIK